MRIRESAGVHVSWGDPWIWSRLRREGWLVNCERVYRLYKESGLAMRPNKPRRYRRFFHPNFAASSQSFL